MMPLSMPLLICQCAILLVSFEGILCPFLDFAIENFSTADIYNENEVKVEGRAHKAKLILKKDITADSVRQHVVPFSAVLRNTLHQEMSYPKVVSFSVKGVSHANFNIKFKSEKQARYFASLKSLPENFVIHWVRIYSNRRPVIVAYEYLDKGDIGFKLLENDNNPNFDESLHHLPYLFKRSEIENAIRTTLRKRLYLRNKKSTEDYEIVFLSMENMNTFLSLFPKRVYDEHATIGYYFIPHRHYRQ